MPAEVEKILLRDSHLYDLNSNWRNYFEDLSSFCLPRKAWINTPRTRGERIKTNFLYDSTAIRAVKTMSAGFHHNLTNEASKWFGLMPIDQDLQDNKDVKLYFTAVEDKIFQTLNRSNFNQVIQEFYGDAGVFGTGDVMTMEDNVTKVRFRCIPIEQLSFEEDSNGRVEACFWNFKLKVFQAYEMWGKDAGETVMKKLKSHPQDELPFLHYVGPRHRRQEGMKDAKNYPFESLWISKADKHLITEGGFEEFPHAVGRFWKEDIEPFGFSPAMDVLPDIKLANAMWRTLLRASMKQTDPPLDAPDKGYQLPLNMNPSAVNYRNPKLTADQQIRAIENRGNIPVGLEMIERVQRCIDEGFYVPLFKTLSDLTKEMTVPEVQRRILEHMVLLAPVVGRFTNEVLSPTVLRVMNILQRRGDLPEPPEMLQGKEFDVVFTSQLAKAQRESDLVSLQGFLSEISGIATVKPSVLDKIDEDAAVDVIANIRGVNPKILRGPKEVEEIRGQRAQQEQAVAAMQAAQTGAEVIDKGASASQKMSKEGK